MGQAQYDEAPASPEAPASIPESTTPVTAPVAAPAKSSHVLLSTAGLEALLKDLRATETFVTTAANQLEALLNCSTT